jgi:SAM-dependent methyltransferase
MGASQFRLLCALGLRQSHVLLDFGCGSLRAGRLFIPYLNPGNYHGVEPNAWLVEDAIRREVGADQVALKAPHFSHDDSGTCEDFPDHRFDFILAQSIFSHTGKDLMARIWGAFKHKIKSTGIVAATFIHTRGGEGDFSGSGWIYPGCVRYAPSTLKGFLTDLGFHYQEIPWFHPRQTWYLAALSPERLIPPPLAANLRGTVFNDPELEASI